MDKMREMQLLLTKIPRGKVTSYKEIAKKLGIHPRAAGKLLNKNTDGIKYPCYKVVYSSGGLGGFGGDLKEKIRRLKKDGVEIRNGKIDKKFFISL